MTKAELLERYDRDEDIDLSNFPINLKQANKITDMIARVLFKDETNKNEHLTRNKKTKRNERRGTKRLHGKS